MEANVGCTRTTVHLQNYTVMDRNNLSTTENSQSPSHTNITLTTAGKYPPLCYPSSTFETAAANVNSNFTQNAFHFLESTTLEAAYAHNQADIAATSQVESAIFFPFVCGMCSLQFNKILDFLAHFKVHNYQNFSEEYFHTCGYVTENLNKLGSMRNVSFFTCGICALPLPSLCLLHEHLVCVEKAASYTVNIKTRVTENIVFTYSETSNQYTCNDASSEQAHSGKNAYLPKPGFSLDMQERDQVKVVPSHAANNDVLPENSEAENNTGSEEMVQSTSTGTVDVTTASSNVPLQSQQEQITRNVIVGNLSDISTLDISNESEYTNVKHLSEKHSNYYTDVHDNIVELHTKDALQEVHVIGTDSKSENQEINCRVEENINKQYANEYSEDITDNPGKTTYHKRFSERLKGCDSIIARMKNNQKVQKRAKKVVNKGRPASDIEVEDDYVYRDRKFDDPKREKRRLLMIEYQKNYRERKRLKALGLWQSRHEAQKDSSAKKASCTVQEEILSEAVSDSPSDVKVPCDVCGLMFKKKNLKRHTETHSAVKAYQCDICFKTFKTKGYLYGHKMHHKTVKDLICDYCGKAFNNGPNLRQHLKIHIQKRTLQCPVCQKMFRSNYILKDHMRRHSDAKPHTCPVCGRTFKIAQEVTRHMMVHSEERPHVCSVCQKGFKCRSNLVKHEKIHSK